jgi:4-diphosphocytidyl-2-C-methyl-D-erythritol kinase
MIRIAAYAKINLTLDVLSRRPDGYHEIASVMQTISLHDELEIAPRAEPGIDFRCVAPQTIPVPIDSSNLVVRAAQSLLSAASRPDAGVSIVLTKRIPSQAGLGGGSSDAAAALAGIDRALNLRTDSRTLLDVAASLGSDVPFFLTGGTAVARGRGEIVTPLDDAPALWMVIVKPDASVSTAEAYAALDGTPNRRSRGATEPMLEAMRAGDVERMSALRSNDFEAVVLCERRAVADALEELLAAGAITAHLCGSGAAVYGIAADEAGARRIGLLLDGRYPHVSVARSIRRCEISEFRDGSTD